MFNWTNSKKNEKRLNVEINSKNQDQTEFSMHTCVPSLLNCAILIGKFVHQYRHKHK